MKVLHVITTLPERYGGPTTVLRSLAHEQALRGHQVTICTTNMDYPTGILDVPADQAVDERGVTVWYHKLNSGPLCFSFALTRWLFEHVSDYDVVHVHGLYRFPPTFAAKLARAKGIPYLIKPHGSLDPYLYQQSPYSLFLKRLYERLFDLPNLHRAGAIQYTTDEEAKRASFLRLSAPGVVVRSGIDWRNFAQLPRPGGFRERMGIGSDQPLVLFLGRLNFKKGLDLLVPAFGKVLRRIPDACLAIVGPDNEGLGAKVRQWCADSGVKQNVAFVDHIPPEGTRQAYVDADVFALTSYTENTGMTVVEAMACGCPVVISDQVNIWPVVGEAGAGVVVPLDIDEISDAVLRVLRDRQAAARMGAAGRAAAEKQFSWVTIVDQLDRVYEALERGERPVDAP
jgi:glycosyltransferase involved in cell wall biosynthesis